MTKILSIIVTYFANFTQDKVLKIICIILAILFTLSLFHVQYLRHSLRQCESEIKSLTAQNLALTQTKEKEKNIPLALSEYAKTCEERIKEKEKIIELLIHFDSAKDTAFQGNNMGGDNNAEKKDQALQPKQTIQEKALLTLYNTPLAF